VKCNDEIENNDFLKFLIEQAMVPVCVLQDDMVVLANSCFEKLYGASTKNLPIEVLLKRLDSRELEFAKRQTYLSQRGLEGTITPSEYRVRKSNGENAIVGTFSKSITYKGRPASLVMCSEIKIMETSKISVNEMLLCVYDLKAKELFNKIGLKHKHIKILTIENLS